VARRAHAGVCGSATAHGRGQALVERELARGELVIPFGPLVSTGRGYYICHKAAVGLTSSAQRFSDWLQREARGTALPSPDKPTFSRSPA
jgi:DNA-binding transcriptional LysR family regulator